MMRIALSIATLAAAAGMMQEQVRDCRRARVGARA